MAEGGTIGTPQPLPCPCRCASSFGAEIFELLMAPERLFRPIEKAKAPAQGEKHDRPPHEKGELQRGRLRHQELYVPQWRDTARAQAPLPHTGNAKAQSSGPDHQRRA